PKKPPESPRLPRPKACSLETADVPHTPALTKGPYQRIPAGPAPTSPARLTAAKVRLRWRPDEGAPMPATFSTQSPLNRVQFGASVTLAARPADATALVTAAEAEPDALPAILA